MVHHVQTLIIVLSRRHVLPEFVQVASLSAAMLLNAQVSIFETFVDPGDDNCDISTGDCSNTLLPGYCLINGNCILAGNNTTITFNSPQHFSGTASPSSVCQVV